MGFWHTGYIDHLDTADGPLVTRPLVFPCEVCSQEFQTRDALYGHRFEAHPVRRPSLAVRGQQVPDIGMRITERLSAADVRVINASGALVNGDRIAPGKLGARVNNATNEVLVVTLENAGSVANFRLDIRIALREHLRMVDDAFLRASARRRLDLESIERLIGDSGNATSAVGYCEGICEYLYGVLAKERSPDSGIAHEEYRHRFNRASTMLADFETELGTTIRALIAFHFNQFREAARLGAGLRVGCVARALASATRAPSTRLRVDCAAAPAFPERLLTDLQSEAVLQWSLDPISKIDDLSAAMNGGYPEFDRTKVRILLAEALIKRGEKSQAATVARELVNDSSFGEWAADLLQMARRGER